MNGPEKFDFTETEALDNNNELDNPIRIPDHIFHASELDDRLPEQRIEAYGDDSYRYEKAISTSTDDGASTQSDDTHDQDEDPYAHLEP